MQLCRNILYIQLLVGKQIHFIIIYRNTVNMLILMGNFHFAIGQVYSDQSILGSTQQIIRFVFTDVVYDKRLTGTCSFTVI